MLGSIKMKQNLVTLGVVYTYTDTFYLNIINKNSCKLIFAGMQLGDGVIFSFLRKRDILGYDCMTCNSI